ncbi:hypothetical protein ACIA49_40390 [Kribbella sp. NPDC051587]|uniref:hypothetical protein n=1 Tax=Kribbella sp. NPDC051587 TaxID=3364119 RepID=UPI00378AE6C2
MRKIVLAATAVAALTAGLQTPAWAATTDAPTDATISWTTDRTIQLTWGDQGEANIIRVEYETPHRFEWLAGTDTQQLNRVILPPTLAEGDRVRLLVSNGDDFDHSAPTAWFDTRRPSVPGLRDAQLTDKLNINLSWTTPSTADPTPGDPMDLPVDVTFEAQATLPNGARDSFPIASGQTSAVLPPQPRPAAIRLVARNEWGETPDTKLVRLGTMGAGISVPASAVYSSRLGIKSTLDLFTSEGREERASGIPVELQARAKTTDAWKTYGRYAGNTTTAFDTGIASLGNREYRLLVPARKVVSSNVIALTPATSTSVKSSTTLVKFTAAGFTPTTDQVGTTVKLSVKIQPAATVQATLQRWDGKKWLNGVKIQLTKGSALVLIKAVGRGTTSRYRVTVPAVFVNGLTVSATSSSAFTLTVR